jgi:hypothetical protein
MGSLSDVNKLLTAQRRRDLRVLHGGRMRKIQEMADEGKIGNLLKSIVGRREPFTMESIRDGDKLITDPYEISRLITKVFREWFYRGDKEAWRDHNISDAIIGNDKDRFLEVAHSLEVPPDVALKVWESCKIKTLNRAAMAEMEELDEYTPSFSEFMEFIDTTNPRSAGGFSGLNYNLLRNLPSNLKERI